MSFEELLKSTCIIEPTWKGFDTSIEPFSFNQPLCTTSLSYWEHCMFTFRIRWGAFMLE